MKKVRIDEVCNFLQPPVISSPVSLNIIHNTLLLNTFKLCTSLSMKYEVWLSFLNAFHTGIVKSDYQFCYVCPICQIFVKFCTVDFYKRRPMKIHDNALLNYF